MECLAYLAALCIDPMRFAEEDVVFHIDNVASVMALRKGYSKDLLASTIVRASRVVAASLGCSLYATWERRRSTRGSIIADDLTHNLVGSLNREELQAYLDKGLVKFPEPMLEWMAQPKVDLTLGRKCVMWICERFPEVVFLRPNLK